MITLLPPVPISKNIPADVLTPVIVRYGVGSLFGERVYKLILLWPKKTPDPAGRSSIEGRRQLAAIGAKKLRIVRQDAKHIDHRLPSTLADPGPVFLNDC